MQTLIVAVLAISLYSVQPAESCKAAETSEAWNYPPRGYEWVSAKNGHIPDNSVEGGIGNNGKPVYVCRGKHSKNGRANLIPGKASERMRGCNVPFGGKEIRKASYEVLVKVSDCAADLSWVDASDGNHPENAVAGGYSCTCDRSTGGDVGYIGRTEHDEHGAISSGKIQACNKKFYYSWGGKEYGMKHNYQALVASHPALFVKQ